MKPELANQLYKGEKARNQILTKQNDELKRQVNKLTRDIIDQNDLQAANKEYQEVILKYEKQSRIREEEYENMQTAIK